MSELLQNAEKRKSLLKHMILQLHKGEAPQEVSSQLARLLGKVPYDEVVEVEQELIAEGLPEAEVLRLCDVHSQALKGNIRAPVSSDVPAGHPVETFKKENEALLWEVQNAEALLQRAADAPEASDAAEIARELQAHFYRLLDVEKHYQRKENLLFPHLERHGITGPSLVMWGKDDEAREKLKQAVSLLESIGAISAGELSAAGDLVLKPALAALSEMVFKEEEILLPMSRDKLSQQEWYAIYEQSPEIGFCLYAPKDEWRPEGVVPAAAAAKEGGGAEIRLPSGSFSTEELTAILNTIPFDVTFVDRNDEVRYFSEGSERIFARNRAILGRNVRRCHPPKSLHVVERIIDDFKSGRQDRAAFWITLNDRFVHIEYFALRNSVGEYLGVLEVSQDLTEKRALTGERRLLAYENEAGR